MKMVNKIIKAFTNPRLVANFLLDKMSRCFGDKLYLKLKFRLNFGHKLDFNNPQTLNEKLNWLKLYDRNPLYNILADKYEVKNFIVSIIGNEYVVPCLGVYENVEDIDYDNLPDQFVIKGTHDSSGAVIIRDKHKIDKKSIIKKYKSILRQNYFWHLREWPYKNIKPRIIVDVLLDDNTADGREITLRDYKFWCFNGEPKYMYLTVKDKNIYENFYDKNFNPVYINHGFQRNNPEFEKPKNFEKMWNLAGKLAKASQTKWVRVDFFNIDGTIYFGEYTFYDWGGMKPFENEEQDMALGKLLNLGV